MASLATSGIVYRDRKLLMWQLEIRGVSQIRVECVRMI